MLSKATPQASAYRRTMNLMGWSLLIFLGLFTDLNLLDQMLFAELLTGKVIEGGRTVIARANLGQTPVYLDNASKDVSDLLPVFEGQNWMQIKNWNSTNCG